MASLLYRLQSSVSAKFILTTVIILILFSSISAVLMVQRIKNDRLNELHSKGDRTISILEKVSGNPIYTYDIKALQDYVDAISNDEEIAYIIIRDNTGRIFARTLLKQIALDKSLIRVKDVYAEIMEEGSDEIEKVGTVELGLSRESIDAELRTFTTIFAFGTGLTVVILSFIIWIIGSRIIIMPLSQLATKAIDIGKGNLEGEIKVVSDDEIGQLAKTFNQMTASLRKSREEIQKRNEELSLLYSIESEINSAIGLENLLDVVLSRTMSAMKVSAGAILVIEKNLTQWYFKEINAESKSELKDYKLQLGEGVLGKVAKDNQSLMINNLDNEPQIKNEISKEISFPIKDFMCVPLIAMDKTTGAFMLINKRDGNEKFSEADLRLLKIIASQTARAIENAQLQEATRRSDRLSTVGQMASTIIHDIKNPMALIKGFADIIGRKSPENKTYVDKIISAIDTFTNMTQELLDFSRGETKLEIKDYRVDKFIEDVSSFLEPSFKERNINYATDLKYVDKIMMDKDKMKRVFFNIAGNARDAMQAQGGGSFTISSVANNGFVEFRLTDTGPGIPEKIRSTLFEPFVTYGKKHGTGLGMAIVKQVIDSHRGSITFETETGKGTTFIIRLPIGIS